MMKTNLPYDTVWTNTPAQTIDEKYSAHPAAELRVTSAGTKYSNTRESDLQKYVEHEVKLSDGTVREVWATDPMDAIRKVEATL